MKSGRFFAMLSRMKYINRWGLMRNTRPENICEHSHEVAVIAHALALIKNRRFGGQADASRAALLALYHDASEILTGDLPTPVKYFNPDIKTAYKQVESVASRKLLSMLPDDLRGDYAPLLQPEETDAELWRIVKAADKISALIKCVEEEKAGNHEFTQAQQTLCAAIADMHLPEADCFLKEFLPAYQLTLDELE